MNLVWLDDAVDDLNSLFEYIGMENPPAAFAMLDLIERRTGQLADYPLLGKVGRVATTRELVIAGTPFIVVYRAQSNQVDILAVIHSAMRWPDTF